MDATLSTRDLKAFAEFCAELAEHDEPATFALAASHALTRLIACDRIIHVEYPALWENPRHVNTRPRPSDAAHFAYAATHSHEHPLAPVWENESRAEAIYRLSDYIAPERWRQTEFYRLGQPTNEYQMVQSYRLPGGGMGSFALERAQRDFTDREAALLALGYSAYRATAEKFRVALAEREERARVAEHLAHVAEASLQVDRYGRILSATPSAQRIVAALAGGKLLPPRLAGWWQACLAAREAVPLPYCQPWRRQGWLKAVCVRPASATAHGLIRLVEVPGTDELCARLRRRFRLSPREAECLQGLQRGRTNSELAQELRVTVRTVENFLFRLYGKLGVANRLAAVRLADAVEAEATAAAPATAGEPGRPPAVPSETNRPEGPPHGRRRSPPTPGSG